MDYKLLAGVLIGTLITIPLVTIATYLAYQKVSARVRDLVNEYGR
ncbi:P3a [Wheat leaf yellowing-associated virus]|uniref:P3a n=1 Tax=Wheat leaf yellowing-associated virus TaxID=2019445 RepID=A0A220T7N7_9VIRU|nr:P3a [Wheat leaf yellowing-associated virus]ASK51775.1 P3a [Wheat leaf yellowing-associated virus]WBK56465.1 P3a protein [Wheat leaf yellowing-associated virus]